jgi:hypothetical protein
MASAEASTALFFGMSLDMIIGMALGMIASPLMMKGIKIIKHRRKMNRLFNEIAQTRRSEKCPIRKRGRAKSSKLIIC